MKKILISAFLMLFLMFNIGKTSNALEISAQSAVVIDADTGNVLFEKDAYSKRPMASTTKIMTALIAMEKLNLEDVVTVSPFAAGCEGSSIWLSEGEHMSVKDLLYGLMLASGNDAATALAEETSGSVSAFTILMNNRAKEIGAENTNFTNPHGLPDESHYTTAYDLALISREAMKNSLFKEIVSTRNKTISWEGSQWQRSLTNHNKLLKMYPYSTGIKTGFTKKAGRCLVSSASKDGVDIIAVTLSAPDDWNDHMKLSDYCFDNFKTVKIVSMGEKVGRFIPYTSAPPIEMIADASFSITTEKNSSDDINTRIEHSVGFPVMKGDAVGKLYVYRNSEKISEINLIAKNDSFEEKGFFDIFKELMKGLMMQ